MGFPGDTSNKEPTFQCRSKRQGFEPWVRKTPWRRKWQLTPVFLPGESHEQRNFASYSPWGFKESDMTELTSHRVYKRKSAKGKVRQRLRYQKRNRETKAETHTEASKRKIVKICQRKECLRH